MGQIQQVWMKTDKISYILVLFLLLFGHLYICLLSHLFQFWLPVLMLGENNTSITFAIPTGDPYPARNTSYFSFPLNMQTQWEVITNHFLRKQVFNRGQTSMFSCLPKHSGLFLQVFGLCMFTERPTDSQVTFRYRLNDVVQ